MPIPVHFGGAGEFQELAKRLERAADQDLVIGAVSDAVDRLFPDMVKAVQGGTDRLPERGGLRARMAKIQLRRTVKRAHGFYRVKVYAAANTVKDPASLNRGKARHLVYGRPPLVLQKVPPGFFSQPLAAMKPQILAAIEKAIKEALRKV